MELCNEGVDDVNLLNTLRRRDIVLGEGGVVLGRCMGGDGGQNQQCD
jgi:hypothetical protein